MLIYQGALAFQLWTSRPAPVAIMMEHGARALAAQA
jgi:shikimate 5-dehydrogenase